MIRKIYIDFIRKKMASQGMGWFFQRAAQYFLIQASFFSRRPLCGPVLGTLVTNYACNYRCVMCDLPSRDKTLQGRGLKELSTDQMKQILKGFSDLGVSGVGFTGGEPLLRKDIFELLKYTKELGMISHLNTNGFFLNEVMAEKVLDSGVDSINISLDGARSETHDGIRGCPGAFYKVMAAIEAIKTVRDRRKIPIRLKTVTVLSDRNIDEVEGLVQLAAEGRVDCVEFIPEQPFAGQNHRASPEFMEKVRRCVRYLLDAQKKGLPIENSQRHLSLFESSFQNHPMPFACYAGYSSLAVDCYGEVYPCVPWFNWDRSLGNVAGHGLKKFWYSVITAEHRGAIVKCSGCYLNCQAELNLLFQAGSCRGHVPGRSK